MTMQPEPGKPPPSVKILLLCALTLAGVTAQPLFDAALTPWGGPLAAPVNPAEHKQDLRAQFGEYREGRISARDMLKACLDKAQYAEKDAVNGKSALAEYIYALRSQVYLDQGNPQAALAEAQKAAAMAPSPGRGAVALGDALRALGKADEAAGAYRQALRNPGYVPEYTVEDPIDAQTLDALFSVDDQAAVNTNYENIVVQGKFTGIDIDKFGLASFKLEGSQPGREVLCMFKEIRDPFEIFKGYVLAVAQTYGVFFATQCQGQIIMANGRAWASSAWLTLLDDCVIINITP